MSIAADFSNALGTTHDYLHFKDNFILVNLNWFSGERFYFSYFLFLFGIFLDIVSL